MLVGLGLVLTMAFAFAAPAKADLLTDLQAQVQALLAQIAAMSGGSSSGGSSAGCYAFTRTHQLGDTGGEVMQIQKFLNSHGAVVSASGAGSVGNESTYFGAKTKAAVAKWQGMNGVSPAAGYWGPITRAKVAMVCAGSTPGIPGVPVTGNGLKVMLAADSPSNKSVVNGQAIAELAKFTFVNPTGSEVTVTNLGFKRIGVSNDSTLTAIYLFNGATRITDSAGLSNTMFNFNDAGGIFKIPAGGTVTITVRSNISGSAGEQIGVQLLSVAASSALDTSVVLPITGGVQTLSTASLGTVALTYNGPSNATENPANEVRVFQANAVVSTHAAWLQAITFENRGSSDDNDIKNLKLWVDGVQVGNTVAQLSNGKATFDLMSAPKKLETGTRVIKVTADLVGGSGETYDIQVRRAADALIVDADLNAAILVTGVPAAAGTANSIGAATLSVVRKTDSPTTNIAEGATSVLLGRWEVRASGESVKIEALTASTTVSSLAGGGGLDNGKIFLNGVQVGSTQDIVSSGTEFSFGSSFIARQGQTEILEIYADAKNTSGTNIANAATIIPAVTITASNAEGVDSGDNVAAGSLSASNVTGPTRTVSSSSASMTKNSAYGNQTIVAGTNNVKLGSFTLSAGSSEGVNVNTITVTLSSNEAGSVTDLMLKDSSTGTQIGSTKASPSQSNSFSASFTIPASNTKTIDVFGNVKSGANAGPWIANVDGSGNGATTGTSVSFGDSAASTGSLQTITVAGSGTLTVGVGVSPDNALIVAGSSMVKVGSFNFTATNSSQEVQELKVQVPTGAATSVGAVTLKYKNQAGSDVTVSQAVQLPSTTQGFGTATFTGMTFYIPANTTKALDVYVDVPTVASGATSGAAIYVLLSSQEGFKAIDAAGNSDTQLGAADLSSAATSGKGTMVVRKTIPTLSAVALDSSTLNAGSDIVLGRVKVTADAAGDLDWGQMVFTVNKTAAVTLGSTSTVKLWEGSSSIGGTFATTTAGGTIAVDTVDVLAGNTSGKLFFRPTATRTVPAGSSATYELRGTVGGLASGSNVSVSIAAPATSVTTDTFSNVSGTFGSDTSSFVWSDLSVNTHVPGTTGGSTSDWTDDYLVKSLPLTIGNKSVSF